MEFPVLSHGRAVGVCTLTEQGLYWQVDCRCQVLSDRIERLWCGDKRLGVLEREGENLTCHRRVSKASFPQLPPQGGYFTLEREELWRGKVAGCPVEALRRGDTLLFPYDREKPCPCEPLICFFTVRDGFWELPLYGTWEAEELKKENTP